MPALVLKIDVDTYRGTLIGVPRLVDLLRQHDANASFLFSLGPDHTGRAIKRAFRRGFMQKVSRTSVVSHYGLKTLLYGTLLPGPDIGRRCADILRGVRDAGFETGIHCWDHIRWQDGVRRANVRWTEREMDLAGGRYREIFGEAATVHGAAGWQMNGQALRLTQRLGFSHASDCRGSHPFMPVWNAEIVNCPQLPTTLPTLDELIGIDGIDEGNVHQHLLALTSEAPASGHVFTLHAELEGMKLLPVLDKLLLGWRQQGYALSTLRALRDRLDLDRLPRHEVVWGTVPGRSGELLLQGDEFLARRVV
ncbi:MAG: 4-deoxy-4-formamido-L-arabinose-phosphoundecaprenol deformylase [Rhodobacteraceae bacterium]|uniref:4-deoxy-4-formamido-L-arabinose- phosphoundecaprenol deformylase n=1 Tax=Accumulibacter sp. TaxID=2053492 RepID=UPI0019E7BFD0|nr:4-deoxy-4-formamido-L-arabinose-phosphoundecaprenol deformylase [Accumulibacter sp.]MBE2258944.1 4-deoxy-4-formamido-L-arabinose-phosphoundecaprenol deformylase [Paracoccaceae bacterium]MCB1941733.1 4-deoxy-4-formamido-L-arabinose-phosphoundecaprenol deformylase [Accumulibacter sp.]